MDKLKQDWNIGGIAAFQKSSIQRNADTISTQDSVLKPAWKQQGRSKKKVISFNYMASVLLQNGETTSEPVKDTYRQKKSNR